MSIATLITDGFGSFGAVARVVMLGLEPGTAPVPVVQQFSGGFYEVPEIRRRRSVQEERERLGIIPKAVRKIVKRVARQSINDEQTDQVATGLLQSALARLDMQPAPRFVELLQLERDALLERDIALALRIRAKRMADEEDDRDAEMLLM